MTANSVKVREVVVAPLAARREALALIGIIGLIILLMTIRFAAVRAPVSQKTLKKYQQKETVLRNQAPTLYRSMLGVVEDITDLYVEMGTWPSVDMLRDESLPPFAVDFLPTGLRGYAWTSHVNDGWVDYFGINQDVGKSDTKAGDPLENSFMLRLIDLRSAEHPHPHLGKDNDPAQQFSHQIWMYPEKRQYPGETVRKKGWKWIVSSSDPYNGGLDISESP